MLIALRNAAGFQHAGYWHMGFICRENGGKFSTLKFNGQACDTFKLAELQQLHVEPNSEHKTSSHHSFTYCRNKELCGQGYE